MMTEDFSVFFNPDEMGDVALFGPDQEEINGIFEDPFKDIKEGENTHISTTVPTFTCPKQAVQNYGQGTAVYVDERNWKIKDKKPDGTGLVHVLLWKASS